MLFKLLYPDEKLKGHVFIFPRSNGLHITKQQNKYFAFLYFDIINSSRLKEIKIESIIGKTNVDNINMQVLGGLPCVVQKRIIVPMRLEVTMDETSYQSFCNIERTKNEVIIDLEMVFSANNRTSMIKYFGPFTTLVRTNEPTSVP
jgi:hypothetical protein